METNPAQSELWTISSTALKGCEQCDVGHETLKATFAECGIENVELLSTEATWNEQNFEFPQGAWTSLAACEPVSGSSHDVYYDDHVTADWTLAGSNRMSGLSDTIMSREVSTSMDHSQIDEAREEESLTSDVEVEDEDDEESIEEETKADIDTEAGDPHSDELKKSSSSANRKKRKYDVLSDGPQITIDMKQIEDLESKRPVTRSCVQTPQCDKTFVTSSSVAHTDRKHAPVNAVRKEAKGSRVATPNSKQSPELSKKVKTEREVSLSEISDTVDEYPLRIATRGSKIAAVKADSARAERFVSDPCRKSSRHCSPRNSDALEVMFEGDWWEAFQVDERPDGYICIRYVGGSSTEDEWLPRNSARIRQCQDPARMRRIDRSAGHEPMGRRPECVTFGRTDHASGSKNSRESDAGTNGKRVKTCAPAKTLKFSPTPDVSPDVIRKEEEVKKSFRAKGLDLRLNERVSVVNKKVDIHLKTPHKFSRTLLLQHLMEGRNNLPNHIVEVLQIRSNGQDAKRPDSAIFGKPVTLHMMVKTKGRRGNCSYETAPSKVVIRFYKETLGSDDTNRYLIQFNAGGQWTNDNNIASLVVDLFEPFGVMSKDVNVRTESSLYSVSNTNTFPGHRIDIHLLISKLKKSGHTGAKLLGATGGVSMEFTNPQCKPQIQVTGTIYVPFCGEPRRARLTVLQLLLQHSDTIQRGDS